MEWKDLEYLIKEYLSEDNAITVPGSGNGKHEEDVIGYSTISQCKYTDKENISILKKDIDRLTEACKLQNKVPLFVNKSKDITTISLMDYNSKECLKTLIIIANLNKLNEEIEECNDINTFKRLSKQLQKTQDLIKNLKMFIGKNYSNTNTKLTAKYNNLIQHNLFDNEFTKN